LGESNECDRSRTSFDADADANPPRGVLPPDDVVVVVAVVDPLPSSSSTTPRGIGDRCRRVVWLPLLPLLPPAEVLVLRLLRFWRMRTRADEAAGDDEPLRGSSSVMSSDELKPSMRTSIRHNTQWHDTHTRHRTRTRTRVYLGEIGVLRCRSESRRRE
jgi:hypothetical protein